MDSDWLVSEFPMLRIVVAGSPEFDDYELLREKLDHFTSQAKGVTILTGHQNGLEKWARWWAYKNWYPYEVYRPECNGRITDQALMNRNEGMLSKADAVIAFVHEDDDSDVLAHLIRRAKSHHLQVKVVVWS